MVLIAENEDEMKSMLERLEGYINRKGLKINVGMTKIRRFGRGREKEENEMEMERESDRRGEGIRLPGTQISGKWEAESTRKGKSEEGGKHNRTGMEDW